MTQDQPTATAEATSGLDIKKFDRVDSPVEAVQLTEANQEAFAKWSGCRPNQYGQDGFDAPGGIAIFFGAWATKFSDKVEFWGSVKFSDFHKPHVPDPATAEARGDTNTCRLVCPSDVEACRLYARGRSDGLQCVAELLAACEKWRNDRHRLRVPGAESDLIIAIDRAKKAQGESR